MACTECGKVICVTHMHETRSGKRLCADCTRARKQRHHQHGEPHEDTRFDSLDEPRRPLPVADEEVDEERAILTASAYKPIPPWKLSLYASGAAALIMAVVLVVPQFRLVAQPWSSLLSIVLCVISGFWGVMGLVSPNWLENRPRNLFGLSLAVVALLMAGVALKFDTNTRGDQALEAGMMERQNMSPEELREWRRQRLNRFKPEPAATDAATGADKGSGAGAE